MLPCAFVMFDVNTAQPIRNKMGRCIPVKTGNSVGAFSVFSPKSGRHIRDRPFNLKGGRGVMVFLFRLEFFFQTAQELEYLFFLSGKAQFFFSQFNIRLCQKL